jgi:hypothetical protein
MQCHPLTPSPSDIWVTNDLQSMINGLLQVADLGKLVELRGFEPLTPSMRTKGSVVQIDGGLCHLVIYGDGRVRVVRAEASAIPGGLPARRAAKVAMGQTWRRWRPPVPALPLGTAVRWRR